MEDTVFSMHYPKDKSTQYIKIVVFIIFAVTIIGILGFGERSNSFISKVFIFIFGAAFLIVIYENFLMLLTLDEVVLTNDGMVTKKRQKIAFTPKKFGHYVPQRLKRIYIAKKVNYLKKKNTQKKKKQKKPTF